MTPSDYEQPAGEPLRRPSKTNFTVRVACAATATFGALNLTAAQFTATTMVMDLLALATLVAGIAGVMGNRAGAYATLAAISAYLVLLSMVGLALATGQASMAETPSWIPVDAGGLLALIALSCVAILAVIIFGLWMDSSGKK